METMTNMQIEIFNAVKKVNRYLDENESSWNTNHVLVGKKKSLEGILLHLKCFSEGKIKYEGSNVPRKIKQLFGLLDKLLGDMDCLMKAQRKNSPGFFQNYLRLRNLPDSILTQNEMKKLAMKVSKNIQ